MRTILTILTICCLSIVAKAQAAYQGGSGDGYAMDELVLRQTNIEELESNFKVYPTLLQAGQPILIELNNAEEVTIELTDLSGRSVSTQRVTDGSSLASDKLLPGLYLLYIGESRDVTRITIVE